LGWVGRGRWFCVTRRKWWGEAAARGSIADVVRYQRWGCAAKRVEGGSRDGGGRGDVGKQRL